MIAIRTAADRDLLRNTEIRPRYHRSALANAQLAYAPALSFPQHATAQSVIDALRMMRPGDESVYYLFVTDAEDHLVGVLSLRQIVTARPETRIDTLMSREVVSLPADMELEKQAHLLAASGFLALPVLDAEGRLVGSLHATELLESVQDEATEDMFHLAGIRRTEDLSRPIAHTLRDRMVWLALGLLPALLVALVVSSFQTVLAQVAMLAAFMPMVANQGSSAGRQTLTFIVRSLALGTVSFANTRSILLRELLIGVGNGLIIGLLAGLLGLLWQGSWALGLIVGLAMLGNLIIAALAGVVVPLLLKALKIDPALASSVVVTTATDACGFGLLLGLGALAIALGYLG